MIGSRSRSRFGVLVVLLLVLPILVPLGPAIPTSTNPFPATDPVPSTDIVPSAMPPSPISSAPNPSVSAGSGWDLAIIDLTATPALGSPGQLTTVTAIVKANGDGGGVSVNFTDARTGVELGTSGTPVTLAHGEEMALGVDLDLTAGAWTIEATLVFASAVDDDPGNDRARTALLVEGAPEWWNATYRYRLPLTLTAPTTPPALPLVDFQVRISVDLQSSLVSAGSAGDLDVDAVVVVGPWPDGTVGPYPSHYSAEDATNIAFVMRGELVAGASRSVWVYFDDDLGFDHPPQPPLRPRFLHGNRDVLVYGIGDYLDWIGQGHSDIADASGMRGWLERAFTDGVVDYYHWTHSEVEVLELLDSRYGTLIWDSAAAWSGSTVGYWDVNASTIAVIRDFVAEGGRLIIAEHPRYSATDEGDNQTIPLLYPEIAALFGVTTTTNPPEDVGGQGPNQGILTPDAPIDPYPMASFDLSDQTSGHEWIVSYQGAESWVIDATGLSRVVARGPHVMFGDSLGNNFLHPDTDGYGEFLIDVLADPGMAAPPDTEWGTPEVGGADLTILVTNATLTTGPGLAIATPLTIYNTPASREEVVTWTLKGLPPGWEWRLTTGDRLITGSVLAPGASPELVLTITPDPGLTETTAALLRLTATSVRDPTVATSARIAVEVQGNHSLDVSLVPDRLAVLGPTSSQVRITNTGGFAENVTLTWTVPDPFLVSGPTNTTDLAPGGVWEGTLEVRRGTAGAGSAVLVTVTATTADGVSAERDLLLFAGDLQTLEVSVDAPVVIGAPGEELEVLVEVTNLGGLLDDVDLTVVGAWENELSLYGFPLQPAGTPGDVAAIELRIKVPDRALAGTSETLTLEAISTRFAASGLIIGVPGVATVIVQVRRIEGLAAVGELPEVSLEPGSGATWNLTLANLGNIEARVSATLGGRVPFGLDLPDPFVIPPYTNVTVGVGLEVRSWTPAGAYLVPIDLGGITFLLRVEVLPRGDLTIRPLDEPDLGPGLAQLLRFEVNNTGNTDLNLTATLVSPGSLDLSHASVTLVYNGSVVLRFTLTPNATLEAGPYGVELTVRAGEAAFPVTLELALVAPNLTLELIEEVRAGDVTTPVAFDLTITNAGSVVERDLLLELVIDGERARVVPIDLLGVGRSLDLTILWQGPAGDHAYAIHLSRFGSDLGVTPVRGNLTIALAASAPLGGLSLLVLTLAGFGFFLALVLLVGAIVLSVVRGRRRRATRGPQPGHEIDLGRGV